MKWLGTCTRCVYEFLKLEEFETDENSASRMGEISLLWSTL